MPTTTTTKNKLTITLSDRPPVRIDPEQWPVVASADERPGSFVNGTPKPDYETDHYAIKVREHADGRRIVYGSCDAATAWTGSRDAKAGYLLAPPQPLGHRDGTSDRDDETIRAIRRVAGAIGNSELGEECVHDLPPTDLA
jgi:hypothetical protein